MPFTRPMGPTPSSPKAKPKLTATLVTTSASSTSIVALAAQPQTIVFAKSATKGVNNDKNSNIGRRNRKGAEEVKKEEYEGEVEGDKTASQTEESEYSIVWFLHCRVSRKR